MDQDYSIMKTIENKLYTNPVNSPLQAGGNGSVHRQQSKVGAGFYYPDGS